MVASNPVILKQGMSVGSNNAESDDDFLFECFVTYPPVEECINLDSSKMIIAGRTGSGKTAILRHIEANSEHNSIIDPFDMSMEYISNSDQLTFVQEIAGDIDILFQVLWKHIICIEFIRLKFGVDTEEKSRSIFNRLSEMFANDPRKEKALSYLKRWEGRFWITMDQNVKEIVSGYERQIDAQMSTEFKKFRAGGNYAKRINQATKTELVNRTKKIINPEQLAELNNVITLIKEEEKRNTMSRNYLIIDKLDESWVDTSIRFRLIRALLQSIKSFRGIPTLKILIALRSDILERALRETNDVTFQREKFEDYFVRLRWTKNDLKSLIDKRVSLLFKRQYTKDGVTFEDIFADRVGKRPTFEYMIDRTLLRPRDIIAFVNECIDHSDGTEKISMKAIKSSELIYSTKRRDALVQEWRSVFFNIRLALDYICSKRKRHMEADDILDDPKLDDLAFKIIENEDDKSDPLYISAMDYLNNSSMKEEFVRTLITSLYRIGAIGVRSKDDPSHTYAYMNNPIVENSLIFGDTKVRIHPMLYGAYRLNDT